jgi:hypothetical protein
VILFFHFIHHMFGFLFWNFFFKISCLEFLLWGISLFSGQKIW